MSADRELDLYRAGQFAGLLIEHTTKLWPATYQTEMPAAFLVSAHNNQVKKLAFLACELDRLLQELGAEA
jgi:hypothetical protein